MRRAEPWLLTERVGDGTEARRPLPYAQLLAIGGDGSEARPGRGARGGRARPPRRHRLLAARCRDQPR
ncbi:hypothetical protein PEC18_37875 [Paucibacter sp. O1-1]|nr:hypothetical protein [Paucibacter sp. O1-1]MDA3831397.1 hypothetical protein [Paucibacter sp. O1-1]